MFKSLFGKKEKWEAEIIIGFKDLYLDMGGGEHLREVPNNAKAIVTVYENTVEVEFVTVRNYPYNGNLKLIYRKNSYEYKNIRFIKQIS